jgi:prepilin-type N-terminal cleavage/methylation domain-containing protein
VLEPLMKIRSSQRGFTAIELMTVVVIAGILLVLALPAFNDMLDRRRIEGQANELVTDLSYAKSEAVQRNRNVLVRTDPGGTTCYIVAVMPDPPAGATCDCTAAPGLRCTGGAAELKLVTLSNGITVSQNREFQFEPVRGAMASAAAASAAVGLGSRSYTVLVTVNGRVTPFSQ